MNDRLKGLDSIRFVCASWVAVNHVGLLPATWPANLRFVGVVINGPAAVIAFFVISGFCIHFPFRHGATPFLPEYLCRRFIRIGVPMAVAMALVAYFGSYIPDWSLYAELVYYAMYPALLWAARRVGWRPIVLVSYALSAVVIATWPGALNYPSYPYWNWLLGLPCWTLGCSLAQTLDEPRPTSHIWYWRAAVWAVSTVALVLRFHSPIGYPATLNLFALLVVPWLGREIAYWRHVEPPRLLEWAGTCSYTLYLVHILGASLPQIYGLPGADSLTLQYLCIAALTAAFYLLVERPAQTLAKWAGRHARKLRKDADASPTRRAA